MERMWPKSWNLFCGVCWGSYCLWVKKKRIKIHQEFTIFINKHISILFLFQNLFFLVSLLQSFIYNILRIAQWLLRSWQLCFPFILYVILDTFIWKDMQMSIKLSFSYHKSLLLHSEGHNHTLHEFLINTSINLLPY